VRLHKKISFKYYKFGAVAKWQTHHLEGVAGRPVRVQVSPAPFKIFRKLFQMLNLKINTDAELRLLELEHAAELFALTDKNRPYLREWLPWLDTTVTVDDTKFFIQCTLDKFSSNKAFETGIWYKGKLAGVIGLHEINWEKNLTAIGYWIGAEFQGLGLVTGACKAVINYTFTEFKLKKIFIYCAIENYKSRAIPERLGFTMEGIKENAEMLYGTVVDHAIYSLKNV
jgi:ribosomal-protein-serine acetyltransferase